MSLNIQIQPITDDLKKEINGIFAAHALEKTGMDGLKDAPVSFAVHEGDVLAGVIVVQLFWGQLHVKNLAVKKEFRGRGIATDLMEHAHAYGIENGCGFAFVETMNFQAGNFYAKLGYERQFTLAGFAANTSFIYMKKVLRGN